MICQFERHYFWTSNTSVAGVALLQWQEQLFADLTAPMQFHPPNHPLCRWMLLPVNACSDWKYALEPSSFVIWLTHFIESVQDALNKTSKGLIVITFTLTYSRKCVSQTTHYSVTSIRLADYSYPNNVLYLYLWPKHKWKKKKHVENHQTCISNRPFKKCLLFCHDRFWSRHLIGSLAEMANQLFTLH